MGGTTTEDGHPIWYSWEESNHRLGGRFILNKDRFNLIIRCTLVNSRLILICIAGYPKNISIIYAPTSEYGEDEI